MWVSVTNAGVRSPLSLEVADVLLPNRFKRPPLFGSAVSSSCCYGYCKSGWELRFWLPVISS
ncbi:uncharacterized protein DS421_10g301550 [Arachis hypogaea]|nr:uncharacterized protein DS421_10g301550 [Arachis hypogaea]